MNFQEGRGSVLSSSLSNTYGHTHERAMRVSSCGFIVSMTSEYKSINYSSTLESRGYECRALVLTFIPNSEYSIFVAIFLMLILQHEINVDFYI